MSEQAPIPKFGYWHDDGCERGYGGCETTVETACGCEARLVAKLQQQVKRMAAHVRFAASLVAKDRRAADQLRSMVDQEVPPAGPVGGATQILSRDSQPGDRGFMTFLEMTDAYGAWIALREASADPLDKIWLFIQGGELSSNNAAGLFDADGLRELRGAIDRALKHLGA